MPNAAPISFLKPLKLPIEEVESFDVSYDHGLGRFVRGFEIGGSERAAHAMISNQFVHPSETLEVVLIEFTGCRRAQHGSAPSALRPRIGPSGTSARQATASDPARMSRAISPLGGAEEVIPVLPPCVWTSTEMDLRTHRGRPTRLSAVLAAAVEPRRATPPASIAGAGIIAALHIPGMCAKTWPWPQQSILSSPSSFYRLAVSE